MAHFYQLSVPGTDWDRKPFTPSSGHPHHHGDVKTPRHNKQQHLLMYRRVTYGKRRNTDSNNADYVESLTRFNDHDWCKHVGLVLIQLMSLSEL